MLKLADAVVENQPGDYVALSALGAAQYRAENFDQAIHQLVEAQAAYKPADELRQPLSANLFFLAMAHARLGHTAEAKRRLDKAIESEASNSGS